MTGKKNSRAPSPLTRVLQPFQDFIRLESAGGLLLLACTVAALLLANSSLNHYYRAFWQTEISFGIKSTYISKSLLHWTNDGLMSIFFFVVGLEIKRELLIGELASIKRAILPLTAALGGMIIPAAIFYCFTAGTDATAGWGIPMATDIAFSLGVLMLLGSRIPHQLKIFLAAFAIVDDLGAVLVIALFYGTQIHWFFLAAAGLIFLVLLSANWSGILRPSVYLILGVLLWAVLLESGIHGTIAGVLLAVAVPSRSRIDMGDFIQRIQSLLERFKLEKSEVHLKVLNQQQQSVVQTIEISCHSVETPLQRFEHKFHPWVTFAIMPLFAFANAGVVFDSDWKSVLNTPIALGIIFGLVIGKQVGITLFSWLAVRFRLAILPTGVSWKHIYGISWLGGIGFTMSLFIANLAFSNELSLDISKTAVLAASFMAGSVGALYLFFISDRRTTANAAADRKE